MTKTPLPSPNVKRQPQPLLEVKDEDSHIRAMLRNYGKQVAHKMPENRALLNALAEELGRKLVLITLEKDGKKANKTVKGKAVAAPAKKSKAVIQENV